MSDVGNFTNDSSMMIAWERHLESERADAFFVDPFAKALAGSKGQKLSEEFGSMCSTFEVPGWEEFHKTWVAVRTKYIDDFVRDTPTSSHSLSISALVWIQDHTVLNATSHSLTEILTLIWLLLTTERKQF